MKTGVGAVGCVSLCTELLDKPSGPHDRLEYRLHKIVVSGNAVDIGGDADKLALGVKLDIAPIAAVDCSVHIENGRREPVRLDALCVPEDVGFGFLDQARPQQSEG